MEVVKNRYLNKFEYNNILKMGSDEEQTRIEVTNNTECGTENVNAVSEEKVENIVTIPEVADTTVIISEVSTQPTGLSLIGESSLSDDQKKLANLIYDSTKSTIQSFISDHSLNNTLKITKTLGKVIKHVEGAKIGGKAPTGADKRAVAIELGRILIKEVTPDDKGEAEILVLYDLIAEPTLESMIEVSRVVNVAVQEMAAKCCPGLLELFKRSKKASK